VAVRYGVGNVWLFLRLVGALCVLFFCFVFWVGGGGGGGGSGGVVFFLGCFWGGGGVWFGDFESEIFQKQGRPFFPGPVFPLSS